MSNSPGAEPFLPHVLMNLPSLRELHDARVGVAAMSVGDEDIAVGRDEDGGRRIELVRAARRRRPALPSVISSLPSGLNLKTWWPLHSAAEAVGDPDIAVAVDVHAVRENEHAGAEALHQLAGRVELQNRIEVRAVAIEYFAFAHLRGRNEPLRTASFGYPDAAAVTVDIDARRRTPDAAIGHLAEAFDGTIRVGRRIGRRDRLSVGTNGRERWRRQS